MQRHTLQLPDRSMVCCHDNEYSLKVFTGTFRLAGKVSRKYLGDSNEKKQFLPLTVYINYGFGSTITKTVEHTFHLDGDHVTSQTERAQPVPRYWASKKIDELLLSDDEESKKLSTELGKQYR